MLWAVLSGRRAAGAQPGRYLEDMFRRKQSVIHANRIPCHVEGTDIKKLVTSRLVYVFIILLLAIFSISV